MPPFPAPWSRPPSPSQTRPRRRRPRTPRARLRAHVRRPLRAPHVDLLLLLGSVRPTAREAEANARDPAAAPDSRDRIPWDESPFSSSSFAASSLRRPRRLTGDSARRGPNVRSKSAARSTTLGGKSPRARPRPEPNPRAPSTSDAKRTSASRSAASMSPPATNAAATPRASAAPARLVVATSTLARASSYASAAATARPRDNARSAARTPPPPRARFHGCDIVEDGVRERDVPASSCNATSVAARADAASKTKASTTAVNRVHRGGVISRQRRRSARAPNTRRGARPYPASIGVSTVLTSPRRDRVFVQRA